MNRMYRTLAVAFLSIPAVAGAETTANVGWVSDYIFRGVPQSTSSASIGLDYEQSGFYLGTWAADVNQGSEVDLYFGYSAELFEGVNVGLGATGYFYTEDFDDTYREINLSVGGSMVSLDAAFGEYDNFDGPAQKYSFASVRADYRSAYALIGSFGQDFDGEYYEAGFGAEVAGFDVSLAVVHSTAALIGSPDTSIVFGIGKSFGFEIFSSK